MGASVCVCVCVRERERERERMCVGVSEQVCVWWSCVLGRMVCVPVSVSGKATMWLPNASQSYHQPTAK